ncbi:hypothetical protein C0Q70_17782 [Pomacea canaliculata]|uniref:Uncharacterized protein n=1 Tax=Pomacea canaliculata TaxID=400727 RepID=A0A2T7NLD6_POMCA|nr:hypothetical protein C0Q70_17782 [Pomacea canaliculata]
MQTILHNLHLLAEDEKEAMFVISQFKYNSYLTTSIDSYHSHQLPRPDTLRKRVKDYGDFDLLIVHRQYGLVVAVVEACVDESGDEKKTTDDTKLQEEIRNGAKRLKNAEHMIRHLLSDTQWDLPVRKTLMLPNVSQQTVEDVLNKQNKGKTKGKIALTMSSTDMSKVWWRSDKGPYPIILGDTSSLISVCEKLVEKVPNLHLWYASCFHSDMPKGWTGKVFTKPISIPPAILQEKEVLKAVTDCQIFEWVFDSRSPPPTDGPAVKHVLHCGVGHSAGDPHDCDTCSTQVVTYLQSLITDKAPSTSTSTPVAGNVHSVFRKKTRLPELRLCEGDVLVLTEGH